MLSELALPKPDDISVVILAGGEGRRVGYRQKGLLPYQGKPVIESVLTRLRGQCHQIYINANDELERYQAFGEPVFKDRHAGFLGPLAGMQAAWEHVSGDWIAFVPCDNPHLPGNLVLRLLETLAQDAAPLIVVDDGERMQPLYLLMHRSMKGKLDEAIVLQHLSVNRWVRENIYRIADFSDCPPKTFENMNSPEFYDAHDSSSESC